MEREVKGIWIPIEVWEDENLTWNEKILFMEIDSFTSKDKDCFFSNEYIAKLLKCTETSANRVLSSLIKKGYVIKTKFDGRHRFVKTAYSYNNSQSKADSSREAKQGCHKRQGRVVTKDNIINTSNNPNNNLRESKENSHSLESDNENGTNLLRSVNTPSRLQDKKEKSSAKRERTAGGCAPTEQEVRQFFHDRGFIADYRKFYLYYKAKGWKDIEDWEAQAELWELREGSPSDYRRMDAEVAKAQGRGEKKRDTEYEEYCRRLEKEGKK